MNHEQILDTLGVSSTGKAHCPAHDDDKESLSVTISDEGKVLVKCHAGCDQMDLLQALEFEYGITIRDLGNGQPREKREVARYVYRDGGGKPLFTKIRFDPKDFVIEPSGVKEQVLYRLPEILAAPATKTVFWVEGEKAADALNDLGLLATTLGGAAKAPDKAVKVLKNRRVVIIPDNDDAGRKHAEVVRRSLKANGCHVARILHLSNIPVKGDVVDWLKMGHTPQELNERARRMFGGGAALGTKIASPEWAWKPRIPANGLTLIFGEAGVGKSLMVLDLIARWTRGDPMPETVGTSFKPITVGLYGCEDDLSSVVVPRLMAAGADLEKVFLMELDPDRPTLPDQVAEMRQICTENNIQVLVLDNIENGMGVVDTSDSRSLRVALNPLADFGIPVIAIHHPKKGAMHTAVTEAMTGSQAYTNVARSTMMVIPTGEERMNAFAMVKSNYVSVKDVRTLYFTIETREVDGLEEPQPLISWKGGDRTTAEIWQAKTRARFIENQKKVLEEYAKKKADSSLAASVGQPHGFPTNLSLSSPPVGPSPESRSSGRAPQEGLSDPLFSRSPVGSGVCVAADGPQAAQEEENTQLSTTKFETCQILNENLTCPIDSKGVTERGGLDKVTTKENQEGVPENGNTGSKGVTAEKGVTYNRIAPILHVDSLQVDPWVLEQQKKFGYGPFKRDLDTAEEDVV